MGSCFDSLIGRLQAAVSVAGEQPVYNCAGPGRSWPSCCPPPPGIASCPHSRPAGDAAKCNFCQQPLSRALLHATDCHLPRRPAEAHAPPLPAPARRRCPPCSLCITESLTQALASEANCVRLLHQRLTMMKKPASQWQAQQLYLTHSSRWGFSHG